VHSIHVDSTLLDTFETSGYLFGAKIALGQRLLGVFRSLELFQSLDRGVPGCLDERGEWVAGAVFYRDTLTLGRIKYYARRGLIRDRTIVRIG